MLIQCAGDRTSRHENHGLIGSVLEAGYFDEINTFVDTILGTKTWPHSYALSQQSSATVAAAEKSFISGQWVEVDPTAEPEQSPPRSR